MEHRCTNQNTILIEKSSQNYRTFHLVAISLTIHLAGISQTLVRISQTLVRISQTLLRISKIISVKRKIGWISSLWKLILDLVILYQKMSFFYWNENFSLEFPNFLERACHWKFRILVKFLIFRRRPVIENFKIFRNS